MFYVENNCTITDINEIICVVTLGVLIMSHWQGFIQALSLRSILKLKIEFLWLKVIALHPPWGHKFAFGNFGYFTKLEITDSWSNPLPWFMSSTKMQNADHLNWWFPHCTNNNIDKHTSFTGGDSLYYFQIVICLEFCQQQDKDLLHFCCNIRNVYQLTN